MPTVALQQIKDSTRNGVKRILIEQFQKTSWLFNTLPFDNTTSPQADGRPLVYGYKREKTLRGAAFRAYYADYTGEVAETETVTTELKPFGGSFEIDRVFTDADQGSQSEGGLSFVDYQVRQLSQAISQKWHDTVINGDTGVDANAFNGLSKILDTTSSEIDASAAGQNIDLSAGAAGTNNNGWLESMQKIKRYVNRLKEMGFDPQIWCNEDAALRLETVGTALGFVTKNQDTFGQDVTRFGGAPIVDLGVKPGTGGTFVVPTTTGGTPGRTDLYIVGVGVLGFHGVTLTGDNGIKYYSDLGQMLPGAKRKFEAEVVATVALKNTRAAYVLRDAKVL
jgi:hypothetical protein